MRAPCLTQVQQPIPRGLPCLTTFFHLFLEKYIVCDVCGLRSPSFGSSNVLYITPADTSSMQDNYKDCNKNCKNLVLDVIRTLGTWNQAIYYNLQNIYFSSLIDLDTLTIMSTKNRCSIPIDTTVMLGPLKFSLRAIIDHHGPSIHSSHHTASINCCKRNAVATIKFKGFQMIFMTVE